MIAMGSGRAYPLTSSIRPLTMAGARNPSHSSAIRPRSCSTRRGVNAFCTSERKRVWSGGSRSSGWVKPAKVDVPYTARLTRCSQTASVGQTQKLSTTVVAPYIEPLGRLHQALCPRQVLGVRIALCALDVPFPQNDKRTMILSEIDGCFADGLMVVSNCSVGHRTLQVVDVGKTPAPVITTPAPPPLRVCPPPAPRPAPQP